MVEQPKAWTLDFGVSKPYQEIVNNDSITQICHRN